MSLQQEFKQNAHALDNADFQEVTGRLLALLEWMESQAEIKAVIDDLRATGNGLEILAAATYHVPPKAKTVKDIAAVGLALIDQCKAHNTDLFQIAHATGIHAPGGGSSIPPISAAAMERYVVPFLNYVIRLLPSEPESPVASSQPAIPVAIQESLLTFQSDFPDARKVCFIVMQFGKTSAHEKIEDGIKGALRKYGITGLLARDKDYHDQLYENIQTYMHGCGFGISVFERIESDDFNPNVSLEVGYLLGLKKPVLMLKDQTLPALHTDLVGRLYKSFDPYNPVASITPQIERWMEDKGFI